MKIIIIPNTPVMTGRHYCIAKTLSEQGHEVHYLTWALPYKTKTSDLVKHLFTSLVPKKSKYEKFTMHKAVRLPYFWPYINGFLFKHQIRKLFKGINADIIFSESFTNETEVPKELPYIYDLADDYAAPADVYGSFIYKLAFKLLSVRKIMKSQSRNALAVTAVSGKLCEFANQFNKNVIKLPNGVDQEIIQTVKKDKSTYPKNKHSMIYVTGFGKWSRAIETLGVARDLKKEFPNLELTLIGEGTETGKIKNFIKENRAKSYIHYLGFIGNRKTLFELINQHAIGLNISDKNKWRDAAHPIKVLEYSALGKKVVSTDLNEVRALSYSNLFIFSDRDKSKSLKNVLRAALSDPRTSKDFKAVSNEVLKKYSWKDITKKLINLVKESNKKEETPEIVHVTPAYPPNLGGMEKVVQSLASVQKQAGQIVSVITSKQKESGLLKDNIQVTRLNNFTIANTRILPSLFFNLLRLNCNHIIHLHLTSAFMPEIVWLASKIKGFKYIVHLHMDMEPISQAGALLKIYKPLILKRVLRDASFVVVFTKEQLQSVKNKYGIEVSKIKVIPNGVENKFYNKSQRKLPKKPRLLFVGRLEKQKNLPQFFNSLQGISEKYTTTIVGDGTLKSDLKTLAKNLKLKNITFTGRADGKKLLNYYKKSDMFVLPSEREGMPLVLLEAMAMGLPIVATNVTGNRDVVLNNKNGLLAPLGDVKAFRSALLQSIANKRSYQEMSKTSRFMAEQYSWTKIADQFQKLYEKIN